MKTIKILAVASTGGHLVQLMRLNAFFHAHDTTLVSTDESIQRPNWCNKISLIPDVNQDSNVAVKMKSLFLAFNVIRREKPDVIISTGALPGLVCVVIGKVVFRKKTIWVDSIANAEELSKSGKAAKNFSDLWLTQWPQLASPDGPSFLGSVI